MRDGSDRQLSIGGDNIGERDGWLQEPIRSKVFSAPREREMSTHLCQSTLPLVRHPSHDPPNPLSLLKLLLQTVLLASPFPVSIFRRTTTGGGSSSSRAV